MWQTASDFLIFLGWLWQNFSVIVKNLFLPVRYIYTFFKEFWGQATASGGTPYSWGDASSTIPVISGIFNSIPDFKYLIYAGTIGITIIILVFILKTLHKT